MAVLDRDDYEEGFGPLLRLLDEWTVKATNEFLNRHYPSLIFIQNDAPKHEGETMGRNPEAKDASVGGIFVNEQALADALVADLEELLKRVTLRIEWDALHDPIVIEPIITPKSTPQ